MPRKSIYSPQSQRVAQALSLPAPTGGMNARDSLAMMKMDQAILLRNLFPLQYGVQVRKGWKPWATGLPSNVDTLMTYSAPNGTEKMFAAAGNSFYDVTVAGAVGAPVAPSVGSFTNNRWQWLNMVNTFGTFLVAVNGNDTPQSYNGTAWSALSITADIGLYPGFSSNEMINVQLAHRRLWFVERNSGNAWYLPVDQVAGAVSRFNVGELFSRGGALQAIGVWSIDTGAGMDDHTVFISTRGDVAIYRGYDPDDLDNFRLVGVYTLGATIGRRCCVKLGGDLLILGEDGLTPLSSLLAQSKSVTAASALTNIIQQKLSDDVVLYRESFGWEVNLCPRYQFLLINVPAVEGFRQYAMNAVTGAWCVFTGYEAHCWTMFGNDPYFGGNQFVGRAWIGDNDNGFAVQSSCLQAFSYFGNQAQQKRWTMVRPVFNAANSPALRCQLLTDFSTDDVLVPPSAAQVASLGATWDIDNWDQSDWAGGLQSIKKWYSLGSIGYAGAFFIKMATYGETTWIATDFVYEPGSTL